MSIETKSTDDMSRDSFIESMIAALTSAQSSNPDSFLSSLIPITAKPPSEIFRALCFDYPLYTKSEITSLRQEIFSHVRGEEMTGFPQTVIKAVQMHRKGQEVSGAFTFYYHETFVHNIYSITSSLSEKSAPVDPSASSAEHELHQVERDQDLSIYASSSSTEQRDSYEEFLQLYYLIFVCIPVKLLTTEKATWDYFLRSSAVEELTWSMHLSSYRRLIQGLSPTILASLGIGFLQQHILPRLCHLIAYFSAFLGSQPTQQLHSSASGSLAEFIYSQMKLSQEVENDGSYDWQVSIENVKDILTSTIFLVRDLMIQSYELINGNVLRIALDSILPPLSIHHVEEMMFSPRRQLQYALIAGVSRQLIHGSSAAGTRSLSSMQLLQVAKALNELQAVVTPMMPQLANVAEYLSHPSRSSDSLEEQWEMILAIVHVLLIKDPRSGYNMQSINRLHEQLISNRLIVMMMNRWTKATASSSSSLQAIIITLLKQSPSTARYMIRLPNVSERIASMYQILAEDRMTIELKSSSSCLSRVDSSATIVLWFSLALVAPGENVDAKVLQDLSASLDLILESLEILVGLAFIRGAAAATGASPSPEENCQPHEEHEEDDIRHNKEIDLQRKVYESIAVFAFAVEDEMLRKLITSAMSASQSKIIQKLKAWIEKIFSHMTLNASASNEDKLAGSIVNMMKKTLKACKASLEGESSNKVD
jgi:hypothetical protein